MYGISYGKTGEKKAFYFVPFQRSMIADHVNQKEVVLAVPDHFTALEKVKWKQKAELSGYQVLNCLAESEAAVLYHSTQHPKPNRAYHIRVIQIGESGTNISNVLCSKDKIQTQYTKRIGVGGAVLTDKVVGLIRLKLQGLLKYVDSKSIQEKAERLKVRMGSNNKLRDEIEFRGNLIKISRREFDSCCAEWFLRLLMELDYFDLDCQKKGIPKAEATIICGGGGECGYVYQKLKKKYEGTFVTNYKATEACVLGAAIYAKQLCERRKV